MNRMMWVSLAGLAILVALGTVWWLAGDDSERRASSGADEAALAMSEAGRYRAGDYVIELALDPAAPQSGDNRLRLRLRGPDGEPVSGAELDAVARMPAMGAMPEMRAPVEFEEREPGRYDGEFTLAMDGSWPLQLELAHPEAGDARLTFEMATGRTGLQLSSGGTVLDGTAAGDGGPEPSGQAATAGESSVPAIRVDARRRQLIGVRTGQAERRTLHREIRAPGVITWDETGLHDVTLRVDAWVGELHADTTGMAVQQGEVLFTVYGPELLSAQQDYLAAQRSEARQAFGGDGLLEAARKRLALWGITGEQIRQLEQRGEPLDYLPVHAPRDGILVDKPVVEGSAVRAGQPFMRIADLSRVWIEAQLYDGDLPLVREGMAARIRLPALPGRELDARVDYVYPSFQRSTRTARVRLVLDNPDAALKPDMYADVVLRADLGERLVVPDTAVLIAGQRRIVFLDQGEGLLQPVLVETGQRAGGFVEILDGLEAGDQVVTSGTFLLASESRLQGGLEP